MSMKEETRKGAIINCNNHVTAHMIDEEIKTMQNLVRWVKSARAFKNNTNVSGKQGIKKLLLMS